MLVDDLRGMFYIALKDLKAYYFKPPNISWGILFPFAFILAFAIRNPGDSALADTRSAGADHSLWHQLNGSHRHRFRAAHWLAGAADAGAGTAACLIGRQVAGRHDLWSDGDPGGAGGFPGYLWRRRDQLADAVSGVAPLGDGFFGTGSFRLGGGAGNLRGADTGELHPLPDDVPGRRVCATGSMPAWLQVIARFCR